MIILKSSSKRKYFKKNDFVCTFNGRSNSSIILRKTFGCISCGILSSPCWNDLEVRLFCGIYFSFLKKVFGKGEDYVRGQNGFDGIPSLKKAAAYRKPVMTIFFQKTV
jgi:hypothetical protein